jgi:cell surface protein SprA
MGKKLLLFFIIGFCGMPNFIWGQVIPPKEDETIPLEVLPIPDFSRPFQSLLPSSAFTGESPSLLSIPTRANSKTFNVNYDTRQVDINTWSYNYLTQDTILLSIYHYPELAYYTQDLADASLRQLWLNQFVGQVGEGAPSQDQIYDIEIPIRFPDWLRDFGLNRPRLEIKGDITASLRGARTLVSNDLLSGNRSLLSMPNPNLEANLDISGKVGKHLTVEIKTNQNFGRDEVRIIYKESEKGEFENQILQEVEIGKTSLALPGTELTGYSENHKGLFGVRSRFKFGDIHLTAIASQEGASQASYNLNARSQESEFSILDKEFIPYRFYFLNERDRDVYVDAKIRNQNPTPLRRPNLKIFTLTRTGIDSTGTVSNISLINPDGSVYQQGIRVRELTKSTTLSGRGDFYYDELERIVHFRSGRRDAVYAYLESGSLTQGGQLQLFKDESNSNRQLSKLMLRNRYNVGISRDNQSQFQLSMRKTQDNSPGNYLLQLGLTDEKGILDRNNSTIFNVENGIMSIPCPSQAALAGASIPQGMSLVDYQKLVCLEPFRILDSSLAQIYETPVHNLNRTPSVYKFSGTALKRNTTLRVSDSHSVSAGGCFDITPGTEKLKIGSTLLQRGVDYEVQYQFGQIELISDRARDPNSEISVTYECEPLFSIDRKTLLGLRAEYLLDQIGEGSLIGATALYKTQTTTEERPGLGREPFMSFLWGMNLRLTDQSKWMTRFVNWIPLVETKAPSKWRFDIEFARSWHNPNTKNSALIDDFESANREISYPMRRTAWSQASPPGGVQGRDIKTFNELLDYKHQGDFIWHSNFTRRFSDIYYSSGNSNIDRSEISVLQFELIPNDNRQGFSWGGVMRFNSSFATDISNFRYLEVVVQGDIGALYIDLGKIAEDLSINGFEPNGELDSEGDFLSNRALHDNGLDNQKDGEETALRWTCRERNCTSVLMNSSNSTDPAGDNFELQENATRPTRSINGTQGNNGETGSYDTEDLNRNGALDIENDFLRYRIDLSSTKHAETLRYGWKRYRIPLNEIFEVLSERNLSIEEILQNNFYTRLWYADLPPQTASSRIELAKLSIVGNQWEEEGRSSNRDVPGDNQFQLVEIDGILVPVEYSTPSTSLDSNYLQVRVINNRDDLRTYVPSPNTKIERERDSNTPLREQSLVLQYGHLFSGQEIGASRYFDNATKDLSQYDFLEMEIHLDGIGENIPENVRFAIQLGNGNPNSSSSDFYEWSFRPKAARCSERLDSAAVAGASESRLLDEYNRCHRQNWLDNTFKIPVRDYWPMLKLERNQVTDTIWAARPHPDSSYSILLKTRREMEDYIKSQTEDLSVENPNRIEVIALAGNPSLSRVNWMRFVVRVDDDLPANESAQGAFWINDLRLSGVRTGWGSAARSALQMDFADVMTISGDIDYRDGNFATLSSTGNSPLPSLAESKTAVQYQGNFKFALDKMTPEKWGYENPSKSLS